MAANEPLSYSIVERENDHEIKYSDVCHTIRNHVPERL